MSLKIKTYALCKWKIDGFGTPMVFPSYELAYKEMEKQYNKAIGEYSWYSEDETDIYNDSAKISANEGIDEWQIFECEMEIDNLHEFTSAFKNMLRLYSADFKMFANSLPYTIALTTALSEKLHDMQTLLNAAMPDYSIHDNVKKLICDYIINGKKDIEYWERGQNLYAENIADKIAERNEKLETLLVMETIDAGLIKKLIETETDDDLIAIYEEILDELIMSAETEV